MRRIIAGLFQSIDGVVQSPGGANEDPFGGFTHGGWVMPHFDETVGGFMSEVFDRPFDLLLGRRTYDIFAGHWPRVTGDPMADRINGATKYVVTRRAETFAWDCTHPLTDLDAVADVKAAEGPDLLIQGSASLYPGLIARGLIDRMFFLTFPIILGTGKRALDGAPAGGWRLVERKVSDSGVTIGVYEPAGDLPVQDVPSP